MAFDPEVQAAIGRLQNYFNGNAYDPQNNPGGLRNGGHRINFPLSLKDVGLVVGAIGDLQSQIEQAMAAANNLVSAINRVARRPIADQNAIIAATDSYIAMASLTAPRTLTLPPASSAPPFPALYIADESGACSESQSITILAAGSDTIAGQSSLMLASPYQTLILRSNGSNLWTFS